MRRGRGRPRKTRIAIKTNSVAFRLAQFTAATGLTPAEICRRSGLKENAYSQYVNGQRRITVDAALKLREAFGVTLEYLYTGDMQGLPYSMGTAIKASQSMASQRHTKPV
jgi:transcriptional regulator with XRE-family HTH domain